MIDPRIHRRAWALAALASLASFGCGRSQLGPEEVDGASGPDADSGLEGATGVQVTDAFADGDEEGSTGCGDTARTTSWTATGAAQVTVLASAQTYPFSLAVDSTSVYWTNVRSGLAKVPIAGGVVSTLHQGNVAAGLATDSTSIYWLDTLVCPSGNACPPFFGAVLRAPLSGGAPSTLSSASLTASFLAVDGTHVFWSSPSDLQEISTSGGSPTSLWTAPMPLTPLTMVGIPYVVAAANGHLYAAINPNSGTGGTSEGAVASVPADGGPLLTLDSEPNAWITGIAADSNNVYWTNYGSSEPDNTDGTVERIPVGGGTPVTIASGQRDPAAIAIDGVNVYWANAGTESAGYSDGSIVKAPLDGGAPVTLATGGGGVYGIAVDATSVYWTTQNDSTTSYSCRGKVMKLTPK